MRLMTLFLATSVLGLLACAGDTATAAASCDEPARIADLTAPLLEASGLTPSRGRAATLWSHNDSDSVPRIFALGTDGAVLGEIRVPGIPAQRQWEDIAAGPCAAGHCLYIGDFGDNLAERSSIAVIRVPEPAPGAAATAAAERFTLTYPGGPEDAEAMFILPDTSIHIITKGRQGPVTVYRVPTLTPGAPLVLQRVQQLTDGLVQLPRMVTGASASPDGSTIAVRTYGFLQLYTMGADGLLVPLLHGDGLSLATLVEPQGEAVALLDDGGVYMASEAGPLGDQPFLSRTECHIAR